MTREQALQYRAIIEQASASLDDKTASTAPELFPRLRQDGSLVAAGTRTERRGRTSRCRSLEYPAGRCTMTRAKAKQLRQLIEQLAVTLDDETALTGVELFPMWAIGRAYAVDDRVQHGGTLYKCVQAHTSQDGWEPENAASLWAQICESHDGTKYDPIPYDGNMALQSGKYYTQNNILYLCNRDTGQPVYNALAELVGLYVEVR